MRARHVFLALALVSASASFDIQTAGRVYQQGSYPYLKNFAGKAVDSLQECEEECRSHPDCKYGTYVTKDADTSEGYNYQKKAKAGECWLSAQTHSTPTACGVPCLGFRKVAAAPKPLSPPKDVADFCPKDMKTCWDGEMLGRISFTECQKVDYSAATNLVTNGDFSNGMTSWSEHNHNVRINGAHVHHKHGDITGHLHGHCPNTDGGIKQTIKGLVSGATYTLEYTAWSGSWDGHDSDRLDTSIANSKWTVHPNSNQEIQDGRDAGLKVVHTFKATSASAVLKFYSPKHNCIDIDDVSITIVRDNGCDANKCQFGKIVAKGKKIRWGCKLRPTCECDPSLHPSHFNKCHQDPWSRHIVVTHLPRRFHAKAFEEGVQHRCAMVGGSNPVCKCCTCMRGKHTIPAGFVDLGRESHPVLSDNQYRDHKGVSSFDACIALCGTGCKWGSFIARKDASLNSCLLVNSNAATSSDGKLRTVRCPLDGNNCHSFLHGDLASDAIDLGNSKAFIRKRVDEDGKDVDIANPADYKKQDFKQCLWKNNKCEANERSEPGLTGIHKIIPAATKTWCDEQRALGHNMVWQDASEECHYGCHTIDAEKKCVLAEDHFKIEKGDKPCSPGQSWDTAKEKCSPCAAETYQWPQKHFIDRCYQCPHADGWSTFKDLTDARNRCKSDCVTRSTTCSNKLKCGTLVSPELEAFCKANPKDCTTDRATADACAKECVPQCGCPKDQYVEGTKCTVCKPGHTCDGYIATLALRRL